ncbi:hypothetical protein H8356DRAFT_1023624 [Neocallimastix lanati (nom. inval.)]|jgi:hypothetical protein|uniref:Zn(2)-C6 fungal-type domain-containing protein n=1 Tax=Neocallimastix californiae TaxID=1754190 RepID=A0A1Y2EMK2_9FUNG|nr:hypothetical protein H8356DRAFT_1023624 [Neocallimastix sp. JGI-2020a]ORY72783.1 hypothetical protein LY90DRAFT_452260 [Neocallimastix californiae]|eukprot:ORY72783.1 hypothetical protein LY90DRAFT_452260 [Neocallimastix californiae]
MDKKPLITTSTTSSVSSVLAKTNASLKTNTTPLLTASIGSTVTAPPLPLVPLAKKKKTVAKRKKVSQACVYCRRSHMTCDDGRPCQRCIKRNIAHLCHDEPKTNKKNKKKNAKDAKGNKTTKTTVTKTPSLISAPTPTPPLPLHKMNSTTDASPITTPYANLYLQQGLNPFYNMNYTSFNPIFSNDYVGSELNVISDFLATLDDPNFNSQLAQNNTSATSNNSIITTSPIPNADLSNASASASTSIISPIENPVKNENEISSTSSNPNTFDAHESKTEQFILKAADPPHKTSAERLAAFLNAKYEAGLLKPFNHVNGYTRLQKYMEKNLSKSSRQRIINVIELFRPSFRAVAQSLTDIDLILVEEAFERLLLEYDRVFTSMGIPSCLWRRTGEIFKCNKEFADLINMSMDDFKEGKLCIYELLAEESAVNYWEKYGNIAFDPGQKAVLTSCVLRNPKKPSQGVSCCFSFTIRRDKYNIPMMIVGNFLPA